MWVVELDGWQVWRFGSFALADAFAEGHDDAVIYSPRAWRLLNGG